jgi:hypothetical protein
MPLMHGGGQANIIEQWKGLKPLRLPFPLML